MGYIVSVRPNKIFCFNSEQWIQSSLFSMLFHTNDCSYNFKEKISYLDIDFMFLYLQEDVESKISDEDLDFIKKQRTVYVCDDARFLDENTFNFINKLEANIVLQTIQRDQIPRFRQHGIESIWMPENIIIDDGQIKIDRVGFANKIPGFSYSCDFSNGDFRLEVAKALIQKKIPCTITAMCPLIQHRNAPFNKEHSMYKRFNSHKYSMSIHQKHIACINTPRMTPKDMGFIQTRIWQTTMNGCCLFQHKLPSDSGFDYLFKDKETCVIWEGVGDLIDKCKYYLNNLNEVEKISNNVLKLFTKDNILYRPHLRQLLYDYIINNKGLPDYAYN